MGMRIAYVITRADDLGGSQIHVRDVAAALQRNGDQVTVFAGRQGVLAQQLRDLAVPYVEIDELARELEPLRDARGLGQLRSALRAFHPDLVSAHCAKAGVLARLAATSLGVPALFTAHGWAFSEGVPPPQRALYGWMERSVAPLSHRVIVVCDADRRTALRDRIASPRKLRLVYNGVSDVDAGLRARPESSPIRLVTIARLTEQKDHATLLRALAQVRDLDWHLDQIGDGPLRKDVQKLAGELGLADRLSFLGLRTDVAQVLGRAQIYLLISNWEGFPRSILEGMRAGLPVIASDVGGVRESVQDGTTGFVVAPSDVRALADRLRRLIASPSLRARMGKAGRLRYERRFTFERMLDETYAVYEEVVGGASRRRAPMFLPAFTRTAAVNDLPSRNAGGASGPTARTANPPPPRRRRSPGPENPTGPDSVPRGSGAARTAASRGRTRPQGHPPAGASDPPVVEMKAEEGGSRALPVRWIPAPGGGRRFDSGAPVPPPAKAFDEITLRNLLVVVARRWALISAVLLLTTLGMAYVTFRILTPLYESTAVVLIKPGREFVSGADTGDRGAMPTRMDAIMMAELEILHSEDLLRDTVRGLGPSALYPGLEVANADATLEAFSTKFRENFSATAVPGSQVIRLSFRHPDARTAADSVNLLVDRFTEHHLKAFSERQTRSFLEGKVTQYREELEAQEEKVRQFQEAHPVVTAGSPGQEYEEQRAKFDIALKQARNDVAALNERIAYLKQHETTLSRTSDLRQDLNRQLVSAEAELPGQIARRNGLESQLAAAEAKFQALAGLLKTYRELLRERDAAERNLRTHAERLEAVLVSEEMDRARIANISIIQRGRVAQEPSYPRKTLNLAIGSMLGLGLGLGLALLLEGLRPREVAAQ